MLIVEGVERLFAGALHRRRRPGPGTQGGGIANAIVGSLILTFLGIAVATPIGVLAGTYLAEYGKGSKLAEVDPLPERHPARGARASSSACSSIR